MLDGVALDVEAEPEIPDPIDYEKVQSHDLELIQESAREVASATKNESKGELNREMAMALLSDAKKNMFEVDKSITS